MIINEKIKKQLAWAETIDDLIQECAEIRATQMTQELIAENELLRQLYIEISKIKEK
jgi:hypothetical protein